MRRTRNQFLFTILYSWMGFPLQAHGPDSWRTFILSTQHSTKVAENLILFQKESKNNLNFGNYFILVQIYLVPEVNRYTDTSNRKK